MKKKIIFSIVFALLLVCIFAVSVSAYTVNYDGKAKAETDANGVITLRDTYVTTPSNHSVTLKNQEGEDVAYTKREFLGWYSDDGRFFLPGETVTFTEDVLLRQAAGFNIYNAEDFKKVLGAGWCYVKLGADIELTAQVSTNTTGSAQAAVVDLNGHNITSSASTAFGADRSGLYIVGEGKIVHTGTGKFFSTKIHGFNDTPTTNRLCIGQNVEIETAGVLFYDDRDSSSTIGIPQLDIWGKVTATKLANVAGSNNATFTLYDGADITLTSNQFIQNRSNYNRKQININIGNITMNVPEEFVWFDVFSRYEFNITGGSYNYAPDEKILSNGYGSTLDEESGRYIVALKSCPNGTHNYVESELYGEDVNCIDGGRLHYFRCSCGDSYIAPVYDFGHDYSIVTIDKPATTTENGVKRVSCSRCDEYYTYDYSISPLEIEVSVTVKTENGEVTGTLIAKDIYEMSIVETTSGFTCTISTIKDFTINGVTYTKNDIVIATVPSGTTKVSVGIFDSLSNLKEIVFMDRCIITFDKDTFKNLPLLEKITFGECDLIFAQGNSEMQKSGIVNNCPKLTTIDVSKANATFNKWSFASDTTIKQLLMGAGKTYIFREDSFRHSSIEELVFPDNSNVTLEKKCFAETLTIKYIYIGENCIASKSIGDDKTHTSVFGGNAYLNKVILKDITYVSKWALSTKKANDTSTYKAYKTLSDLHVYAHSPNFSFNSEAFNDRANGDFKLYIYTVNPNITSATSTSNYVIYNGIGHAYTEEIIKESTCAEKGLFGYVTDCTCGIDYRNNSYKIIEKNGTITECEAFGTDVSELPLSTEHIMGTTVADVIYDNYFENGTIYYFCKDCGVVEIAEEAPSAEPMMYSAGYSVFEADSLGGICYSAKVNHTAIEFYEINTGKEFAYGLVVSTHNDGAPVIGKDEPQAGAVMADMTKTDFIMLQIKISGIKTENTASEINVCAYAIQDDKIRYLSDKKTYDKAEALTYASIKALTQN